MRFGGVMRFEDAAVNGRNAQIPPFAGGLTNGSNRPSSAIQRRSGDGGFLSNSGLTRSWLALNESTYLATPTFEESRRKFECFCGAPTG
jgi:hypothetical protein